MTWVTAAVVVGGLGYLGAQKQASAAQSAGQQQYAGTVYGADIQKKMFDILNAQQAPYRAAGEKSLTQIQDMLPFFTKMPTAADIQGMPGYQFGLQQGLGSVSQAGNVLSPGSNVDIARQKFGTDYALNVGLPAYLKQRTDIYNTLASIAQLGQKSTGISADIGTQTGSNLASLATGGASALAGGTIGAANAQAAGFGNIGNAAMMYSLMRPSGGGFNPGGVPMDQVNPGVLDYFATA